MPARPKPGTDGCVPMACKVPHCQPSTPLAHYVYTWKSRRDVTIFFEKRRTSARVQNRASWSHVAPAAHPGRVPWVWCRPTPNGKILTWLHRDYNPCVKSTVQFLIIEKCILQTQRPITVDKKRIKQVSKIIGAHEITFCLTDIWQSESEIVKFFSLVSWKRKDCVIQSFEKVPESNVFK